MKDAALIQPMHSDEVFVLAYIEGGHKLIPLVAYFMVHGNGKKKWYSDSTQVQGYEFDVVYWMPIPWEGL